MSYYARLFTMQSRESIRCTVYAYRVQTTQFAINPFVNWLNYLHSKYVVYSGNYNVVKFKTKSTCTVHDMSEPSSMNSAKWSFLVTCRFYCSLQFRAKCNRISTFAIDFSQLCQTKFISRVKLNFKVTCVNYNMNWKCLSIYGALKFKFRGHGFFWSLKIFSSHFLPVSLCSALLSEKKSIEQWTPNFPDRARLSRSSRSLSNLGFVSKKLIIIQSLSQLVIENQSSKFQTNFHHSRLGLWHFWAAFPTEVRSTKAARCHWKCTAMFC